MSAQTAVDETSRFDYSSQISRFGAATLPACRNNLRTPLRKPASKPTPAPSPLPESTPTATIQWSSRTRTVDFPTAGRNGPSNLPRRHCCGNGAQRPKRSKR